jgi:hypothetical protein
VVVAPEYEALSVEDVACYAEEGWNVIMPVCGWEMRRWRETPPEEYTFLQHDNDVPLREAVGKAHEPGMLLVPYINLPATCIADEAYSRVGSEIRRTWSDDPDQEQWALTDTGFRYGHGSGTGRGHHLTCVVRAAASSSVSSAIPRGRGALWLPLTNRRKGTGTPSANSTSLGTAPYVTQPEGLDVLRGRRPSVGFGTQALALTAGEHRVLHHDGRAEGER